MNRFILLCLSYVCVLQFGHPSSWAQGDSVRNPDLDKAMRQYWCDFRGRCAIIPGPCFADETI